MTDDPREQILCRHTVTKAETTFPREALPAWRSVGWLPIDEWLTESPKAESETLAEPESTPSTTTSRKRATEPSKE